MGVSGSAFAENRDQMMQPIGQGIGLQTNVNMNGPQNVQPVANNENTPKQPENAGVGDRAAIATQSLSSMSGMRINPNEGDMGTAARQLGGSVLEAGSALLGALTSPSEPEPDPAPRPQPQMAMGMMPSPGAGGMG